MVEQLAEQPSSRQELDILKKSQLYNVFKKYLRWNMRREDMIEYLLRNKAKLHDRSPKYRKARLLDEQSVIEETQVIYLV